MAQYTWPLRAKRQKGWCTKGWRHQEVNARSCKPIFCVSESLFFTSISIYLSLPQFLFICSFLCTFSYLSLPLWQLFCASISPQCLKDCMCACMSMSVCLCYALPLCSNFFAPHRLPRCVCVPSTMLFFSASSAVWHRRFFSPCALSPSVVSILAFSQCTLSSFGMNSLHIVVCVYVCACVCGCVCACISLTGSLHVSVFVPGPMKV